MQRTEVDGVAELDLVGTDLLTADLQGLAEPDIRF
jgi:hypothetical protein